MKRYNIFQVDGPVAIRDNWGPETEGHHGQDKREVPPGKKPSTFSHSEDPSPEVERF